MLSKPCSQRIKFEALFKCDIQVAFQVAKTNYVEQIISSLSNKVLGLHMKLNQDASKIYYTNDTPPIYKLDNFSDIEQASIDLSIKHKNDPYIRFGSIGYNDNMVILNISHSVADGGYCKYIIDNILDDKNINIPSRFPYDLQDVLKEEYDKAPSDVPFWGENEKVNGIHSNFPSKLHQAKDVSYSTVRIPSKMLQCYDSRNKTLHSFTDSLWSSFFVASVVHSQKNKSSEIPRYMCIPTCVDFRRYLKQQNYSICNLFSAVTPEARVNPKMSLYELGKAMKMDLQKRMARGEDFGILKSNGNLMNPDKKIYLQMSYLGSVNIRHPITDVFINLNMDAAATESVLMFVGFSSIKKAMDANQEDQNNAILRLRYSPTALYKQEVDKMMANIEYVLTKIPKETSIEEAVKIVSSL